VRAELVDSFMRGDKGGTAALGRLRHAMAAHTLGAAAGEKVALDKAAVAARKARPEEARRREEKRMADSPFAILKQLSFGGE